MFERGIYLNFSYMPRPWKSSTNLEKTWKRPGILLWPKGKNPVYNRSIESLESKVWFWPRTAHCNDIELVLEKKHIMLSSVFTYIWQPALYKSRQSLWRKLLYSIWVCTCVHTKIVLAMLNVKQFRSLFIISGNLLESTMYRSALQVPVSCGMQTQS